MEKSDATIDEKTRRLERLRGRLQQFVENGGNLKSPEAVPLGIEFIEAFADLAKDLGYEVLKPIKGGESPEKKPELSPNLLGVIRRPELQDINGFLKLFTFDKKRELEKYCRDLTIHSSDFAAFILACESGQTPFLHRIHYSDFVPEHLLLTDDDTAALKANCVGPLTPGAEKAVTKMSQMFKDRQYLVGHIFYSPDLTEWHFFQFDQRDLEDERRNHWKKGAHVHFLNWLWPHYSAQTLWTKFISGRAKLSDSLHVRYSEPRPTRRARSAKNEERARRVEVSPRTKNGTLNQTALP